MVALVTTKGSQFTTEQQTQIVEWLAAGEPTKVILTRIQYENESQTGCYPWSKQVTKATIEGLRQQVKSLVNSAMVRRHEDAILTGIARREQQMSMLSDVANEAKPLLEIMASAIYELLGAGALKFLLRDLVEDGVEESGSTFEGHLAGEGRLPAEVRETTKVAEARSAGLDIQKLIIKEGQFERAIKLLDIYYRSVGQFGALNQIIARLAGTYDTMQPMDYPGRLAKAEKILEDIKRRAAGLQGAEPEEIDAAAGDIADDIDPVPDPEA